MIYILNYKGLSLVSKAIKMATWSPYSHTAITNNHGSVIEAWHKGGVKLSMSPWSLHTEKTPISVYRINGITYRVSARIWKSALLHVGERYDFRALYGFVPGLRALWKDDPDKWFCSHLVAHVCRLGGSPLFSWQTPLYKISPGLIHFATPLNLIGEVKDFGEFKKLIERG